MNIRFDDIKIDSYGNIERPTLFLYSLSNSAICPISNYYGLEASFNFNDVSEISFEVPDRFLDGDQIVHNDSYDEIRGMRIVRMEPIGSFILVNPETENDGIKEIKSCKAYSLEYELNFKNMPPLDGTYMFYDPTGESEDTMMSIILEKAPNWKVGHVDPTVSTRYRTFDNSSEAVYSFMMNTLQESYSCVFRFDTDNRIINVYDSQNAVVNTPIFLSNKNLIKTLEAEELSDEIVTCLDVYGADDTSIMTVNPMGTDRIYNLDYFISIGDIPKDIAAKWDKWKSDYAIYQGVFSDLFSQLYIQEVVYNTQYARLTELTNELQSLQYVLDTYLTDTRGDHSAEIADTKTEIAAKQAEVNAQQAVVDEHILKLESISVGMSDINNMCRFDKYFTDEELRILNLYMKEDSIQESSYVVSYVSDDTSVCDSISSINPYIVSITSGNLYRSDEYTQLTEEEKNELNLSQSELDSLNEIINSVEDTHLNQYFFTIKTGAITISNSDSSFDLNGTIVNSTLSYSKEPNENGNYNCVVSFFINDPDSETEELYGTSNALFVVSGELSNFAYSNVESENQDTMNFELVSGILTLTYDSTIYQRQNTVQDLYDYGKECLDKLAYPSYDFSIDCVDFMAMSEFEYIKSEIALGRSMNVEFKDGVYLQPIFIGMKLSFDNISSFTLEFSDKFRSNNPEFLLADTIGKSAQTSANLDASKFSYSAFRNSNIQNDVENLIESALDISKKNIINSDNQSLLVDNGGIHMRKLIDKANNIFDPCEVRIVNNEIVFTDDAWETAGLAIGKITINTDGTDRSVMGVVANSLIGEVLIGNKLTIEATGVDQVTGNSNVVHFRVDGSGAYLGNAAFAMQGAMIDGLPGNKILLDPRYGFVAGDDSIFTIDGAGVSANYIDENGNIIYDETGVMPSGSTLFYDINTGNLSIRGNVYAENGYFKGTVEATDGVFKGALDIGDNFKVDEDGNLVCKNANVSGTIYATDGSFSGDIVTDNLTVNSNAKVSGLEVGKNVVMGPDATISWSNIDGAEDVALKNDIPDALSDLEDDIGLIDENTVTTITKNTITTAYVNALNITAKDLAGDTITGKTIYTVDALYIKDPDESQYVKVLQAVGDATSDTSIKFGRLTTNGYSSLLNYLEFLDESDYRQIKAYCNLFWVANSLYVGGLAEFSSNLHAYAGFEVDGTANLDSTVNVAGSLNANGRFYLNYPYSTLSSSVAVPAYYSSNTGIMGTVSSSRRYKNTIEDLSDPVLAAENLYNLKVRQYKYNEGLFDPAEQYDYDTLNVGFIAEEVDEVYPFCCVYKNGQPETWRERDFIPPMLKLIQDQKKEIDELRAAVNELKGV